MSLGDIIQHITSTWEPFILYYMKRTPVTYLDIHGAPSLTWRGFIMYTNSRPCFGLRAHQVKRFRKKISCWLKELKSSLSSKLPFCLLSQEFILIGGKSLGDFQYQQKLPMTWKQVQCLNLAESSKEGSLVKVNRAGEGHTVPCKTCAEYTSSCAVSPIPSFFFQSVCPCQTSRMGWELQIHRGVMLLVPAM